MLLKNIIWLEIRRMLLGMLDRVIINFSVSVATFMQCRCDVFGLYVCSISLKIKEKD